MEAMGNLTQDEDSNRMSMRNSLLVWVFGAVLGWAVAVVAVYTIIRDEGDRGASMIASTPAKSKTGQDQPLTGDKKSNELAPDNLNAIEPAAGGEAP